MNKQLDIFSTDNFVRNAYGMNNIPPVQSCYHFSPIGTKKGQWYIPNLEQLHGLYENKEVINQTRKNLGYDELADCYFYSCNETSNKYISIEALKSALSDINDDIDNIEMEEIGQALLNIKRLVNANS